MLNSHPKRGKTVNYPIWELKCGKLRSAKHPKISAEVGAISCPEAYHSGDRTKS